jgi:hypothetical protein
VSFWSFLGQLAIVRLTYLFTPVYIVYIIFFMQEGKYLILYTVDIQCLFTLNWIQLKSQWNILLSYFGGQILDFEFRALCFLGIHLPLEPRPQFFFALATFQIGSHSFLKFFVVFCFCFFRQKVSLLGKHSLPWATLLACFYLGQPHHNPLTYGLLSSWDHTHCHCASLIHWDGVSLSFFKN